MGPDQGQPQLQMRVVARIVRATPQGIGRSDRATGQGVAPRTGIFKSDRTGKTRPLPDEIQRARPVAMGHIGHMKPRSAMTFVQPISARRGSAPTGTPAALPASPSRRKPCPEGPRGITIHPASAAETGVTGPLSGTTDTGARFHVRDGPLQQRTERRRNFTSDGNYPLDLQPKDAYRLRSTPSRPPPLTETDARPIQIARPFSHSAP